LPKIEKQPPPKRVLPLSRELQKINHGTHREEVIKSFTCGFDLSSAFGMELKLRRARGGRTDVLRRAFEKTPRSENEPLVRKQMSFVSYRVINAALADVEIPHDTGEFRIMNRRHRRIVPPEGEVQQLGHVCLIQLGFLTVGLQPVCRA
jgi:hypothetical protein